MSEITSSLTSLRTVSAPSPCPLPALRVTHLALAASGFPWPLPPAPGVPPAPRSDPAACGVTHVSVPAFDGPPISVRLPLELLGVTSLGCGSRCGLERHFPRGLMKSAVCHVPLGRPRIFLGETSVPFFQSDWRTPQGSKLRGPVSPATVPGGLSLREGFWRSRENPTSFFPALDLVPPQSSGPHDPLPTVPSLQVELQTLTMFRDIAQQLQATCASLGSSLQGLPAHVKDQAQQARRQVEDLQAAFAGVHSFQDLSSSILTQSREQVTRAREALDRMVEYVAQNTPVMWLVGPFAPGVAEKAPEEKK